MKHSLLTAMCVVLVGSAQAAAAADPMLGRYGNTVQMTNSQGKVSKAFFNPDKTVKLRRPDGEEMEGTWEVVGPEICIKMTMLLVSMKRCMPFVPDKKAGDTWTQKGPGGDEVTAVIIAGRP